MGNNRANRSRDELLKEQKLKELDGKIAEKKEFLDEFSSWFEDKKAATERLEEIKTIVGTVEDARQILEEKDEVIQNAKKEKQKIEDEISGLSGDIEAKKALLASLEEKIGAYETAEDIIAQAKETANTVKDDADEYFEKKKVDAKALIDEAKQTAEAEKTVAQTIKESAIEEKNKILSDAKDSAKTIIDEAQKTVKHYYDGKIAEGESQKGAIISQANIDRDLIIGRANGDALDIVNSAKTAAETYASQIKKAADETVESMIGSARIKADEIIAKAEEIKSKAREDAEEIIINAKEKAQQIQDKAYDKSQSDRQKLENGLEQLAKDKATVQAKIAENNRTSMALDRREEALDDEVAERVKAECSETENHVAMLQNFANNLNRENQHLNKLKEAELDLQAKLLDMAELERLRADLDELKAQGITVENAKTFTDAVKRVERLNKQIARLEEEKSSLETNVLSATSSDGELAVEKDKNKYLMDTVKSLTDELNKAKTVTREEMLLPIKQAPSIMLSGELDEVGSDMSELEWLQHIKSSCETSGLRFSDRQLFAYHTAQKIKEMSPMVVLAGISGTGKSELPKNYAIHGGMNFLSIPVKPDWDSPASLFGYYNSIEKRFEATDLVRALYQMSENDLHKQQMMMVLLDEMNLAHPEQYFADLLSKLETCRGMSECAEYDILLGGGEKPEALKIGNNILWTGTMNEDETTKGLSDKVIDRSTLITFPRPRILYDRKEITEIKPSIMLSKKKWSSWINEANPSSIVVDTLEQYRLSLQDINQQMAYMGRNLGHRVWQGIAQYITHYPEVVYARNDEALKEALEKAYIDSIAFKVMPKLRGVETRGENEKYLNEIKKLLPSDLVNDYSNATSLSTELFQWCSADFMSEENE